MTPTPIRRTGLVAALCLSVAWPVLAQETAPATEAPATGAPAAEAPVTDTAAAPATPVTRETIVATVNGVTITVGHLIVARDALPAQYQQMPNEMLLPGLIDQLVQQTLLMQAAGEPDARTTLVLENQNRQILAAQSLAKAVETAVTPEAVEARYNQDFVNADQGSEYNAAHILVETEDEAKAIITELDGGADFDALARERSTGPSGQNAGDLGWFGRGDMVEPFEAAVLTMTPGSYTPAPIQTQFGWHVIFLKETRPATAPALEEVQAEIAQTLQREAIEAELARLQDGALIEMPEVQIDPAVLSDLSILD
jgi:peptidyl-prolyl cis-trans isomerase C